MEDINIKTRFVELRAKGKSFQSIANELGVSKQTLINWSKDLQTEVKNLRILEYDELLSKYMLSKHKRLEVYGNFLQTLHIEIQKRDLTTIQTDKLFYLYLKLHESLDKEIPKIELEGTEDTWMLPSVNTKWEA